MVLQTITPWSWEKPVSLSLRAEQNGQLTRDQRGRPAVAPVAISQQTEDSFALRPAVTVDQPPLAVGVRFPLCPPIFFNDHGPIGPVPRFLRRGERAADPCGGQLIRVEGN